MLEFLGNLFDTSDFPARWNCGNWSAGHGWLHIVSDLGIWSAYFAIPCVLAYFALRRRDLPFRNLVFLFVAFILACGTTHLLEATIFWWPAYRLAGIVKLTTAFLSWATLLALVPAIPAILSLRRPAELEQVVAERTRELAEANERLNAEISHRRQMEEQIREHREWLEVTLQSIGDGVVATDREGLVTLINPVAQTLTGWDADAAAGRPLTEVFQIINEQSRRRVENPVELVLRDGKTVGLANHTVLISRDATERPIDDSAAPILSTTGEILGAVLVFRDVTEQRRIEWERLRLAAIVASSEDAIVGKTLDGTITTWNAGAERLYGYTAKEMIGQSLEVLSPPEHFPEVRELLATLKQGAPARQIETVRRRKDGRLVDVSLRLSLMRNAEGEIIGISGIDRDISERKAADRRRNVRLSVAQILTEETTLIDAAPRIVDAVCKGLQWEIGALWTVDSEQETLRCLEVQVSDDLACDDFLEIMRGMACSRGFGLPGKIWQTGTSRWSIDIADEDDFPRKASAIECGLHTAVAEPIVVKGQFLGVLEFFSRETRKPNPDHQEILTTLGSQIGQFIVRRRADEILRGSEQRLRLALEAGRMGTWEWNISTDAVVWSPSLESIHGILPGTFPGTFEAFQREIHPDDRDAVLSAIQQTLQRDGDYHIEYRLVWPDGSSHWVEARGQLFRDAGDRPERMIGICMDVTERKRNEHIQQFLLDASRSLASLVDYESTMRKVARMAMPFFADWCGVYMPDENGRLRQIAVAHLDPEKVRLAQELDQRYPPDPEIPVGAGHVFKTGRAELVPHVTDAAIATAARDDEHRQILKELAPRSYIGVPLSVRGKTLGAMTFLLAESGRNYTEADLAVAEDLAHRAAIAIENARLYAEVRQADRRKDEFLAMLAHELRNPLAPIRTGLDMLALSGVELESVQLMQQQVEHLVRLVDDLLDVSRIMRGKIQLALETIDLRNVIRRAVEMSQSVIDEQRHHLNVELADEPAWVQGDAVRLTQVMTNLINNAAKYTDPEGHISVTLTCDPEVAVVRVRDDGIGIEPDLLPHVFDLFTQANRAADRAQGGLGIGLTLVLRLIEMHGGTVTAESAGSRQGSLFTVRLPLHEPVDSDHPSGERTPVAIPARKVLIVDDNTAAARMLELLLSKIGEHEIRVAHDGRSALPIVEQFEPDIVFLDIGLPGMNGYEVAAKLRNLPATKNAFLVALTGYGQEEDRRRSLDAGFDEHLVKPPSWEAIERLMAHPRIGRGRRLISQEREPGSILATQPSMAEERPHDESAATGDGIPQPTAPANGRADRLIDHRDQFLAKLAHEISNLVAPVQMMRDVLQQLESPPPAVEIVCGMLEEQLPSITQLVDELQEVVRTLRNDWQLKPQRIEVSELMGRVADKFRPHVDEHGVRLSVDVTPAPIDIEGDPRLLERAVEQLLENALDATRPGDRIELTWERRDDDVLLKVLDTGAGIAPDSMPHIFEPFVRAGKDPDFSNRRLGVGLTFVRRVVERHGGRIEAHSEGIDRGTLFVARLPIRMPDAEAEKSENL